MIELDFETYSESGYEIDHATGKVRGIGPQGKGGVPVTGAPAYAEHPTTDIICMWYRLPTDSAPRGWMPGSPLPHGLFELIFLGEPVEAHKSSFEYYVWNLCGVRRYGFPPLPLESMRCSAAKARRRSLPGALGKLAAVLGGEQKDKRGRRLIQLLSRPNTLTQNRRYYRRTAATDWPLVQEMNSYCAQDVITEHSVSQKIPDLTPYEFATWRADQRVNARGVQVDTESLTACIALMDWATRNYTRELQEITGGAVKSVSEVANFRAWLAAGGVALPNLQSQTVEETLTRSDLPGPARRALEIRSTLGGANVKKLYTLARQLSSDGRLRDQYVYCGADQTGRWAAGGVQLHNITSRGPRADWTVDDVVEALEDIRVLHPWEIVDKWGDPAALLTGCLRGLFTAKPGHDLVCVDFSAIEAVVAACLSRCQWRIEVFSSHGKIYEMSAAKISGVPFEEIIEYKKRTGQHHKLRKTLGKVAELASGYGGWIGAWCNFGADAFMSEPEIKEAILKWRDESPEIVDMWGGQFRWCGPGKWDYRPELYGLEGCFILAIQNPGQWFGHHDIGYYYNTDRDVVECALPSGRRLYYNKPSLVPDTDKLNRGTCVAIRFWGYNTNSQKGPVGWIQMDTYGGRLFENVVQAVSADIQAEAMQRVEAAGYPVVMHTHDELTAEVPEGQGSVEEMERIMAQRPAWASWWPIRAAGWRHKRYQKD